MLNLDVVAKEFQNATRPEDVFGELAGDETEQIKVGKKLYYQLSRAVHPDFNPEDVDAATRATTRLNELWDAAVKRIRAGLYGQAAPTLEVKTKLHNYAISEKFASGDIADLYHCTYDTANIGVFKIARKPAQNEFIKNEVSIIRHLWSDDGVSSTRFRDFLPEIVESVGLQDDDGILRQGSVFKPLVADLSYTLEQIKQAYPKGIDAKDAAWMWRRILNILGYVHVREVIHGAILPSHILIYPEGHEVQLIGWGFSVRKDTRISTISVGYKDWYPAEIFAKEIPDPSLDIYMSAKCMLDILSPDAHPRIKGFLQSCLMPKPNQRPHNAWELLDQFTQLIEQLWGKRRFHKFSMPN